MAKWDIFKVREFEQKFGLAEADVRQMIVRGELGPDDCVRLSGETQWSRVAGVTQLQARSAPLPGAPSVASEPPQDPAEDRPAAEQVPVHRASFESSKSEPVQPPNEPAQPPSEPPASEWTDDEMPPDESDDWEYEEEDWDVGDSLEQEPEATPKETPVPQEEPKPQRPLKPQRPRVRAADAEDEGDEEDDDWLRRDRVPRTEELDLTAMVDVTFLLVLFFMITATYTIQKTLEVPAPDPEKTAKQSLQTLDDLRDDYIIVEIQADNSILVNEEPVEATFEALVEKIREINRETARNEVVVHAADEALHEYVVRVFDAANETGMQRIRLAAPRE